MRVRSFLKLLAFATLGISVHSGSLALNKAFGGDGKGHGYLTDSLGGGGLGGESGDTYGEEYDTVDELSVGQLSIVPNMIGDTTAGGCGGLTIGGALVATVAHPTYACSRLNIAENNSPVIRDRAFVSYRHFHNASVLDIFSYAPEGRRADFNTDQVVFGFEKRLFDNWSVQVQLPINSQLGSDLNFTQDGSGNNLDDIIANGTDTSLGNLAVVLKRQLYQTSTWYWSGGLGVNIPTAPDVTISGNINDPNFDVYDPNPPHGLLTTGALEASFSGTYRNQVVNVQPFLAGLWTPDDRLFAQGFIQLDIPLNQATGTIEYDIQAPGPPDSDTESGRLGMQTLLRLNVGAGRWLYKDDCGCGLLRGIAAMFELHYTTTLTDPDAVNLPIPLNFNVNGLPDTINLNIAGLGGRVDALNAVAGIPVVLGKTTIYNGFTVPLRNDFDRGFDFEYSLIVDRRF